MTTHIFVAVWRWGRESQCWGRGKVLVMRVMHATLGFRLSRHIFHTHLSSSWKNIAKVNINSRIKSGTPFHCVSSLASSPVNPTDRSNMICWRGTHRWISEQPHQISLCSLMNAKKFQNSPLKFHYIHFRIAPSNFITFINERTEFSKSAAANFITFINEHNET